MRKTILILLIMVLASGVTIYAKKEKAKVDVIDTHEEEMVEDISKKDYEKFCSKNPDECSPIISEDEIEGEEIEKTEGSKLPPGIEKKVEEGKELPPGIEKKFENIDLKDFKKINFCKEMPDKCFPKKLPDEDRKINLDKIKNFIKEKVPPVVIEFCSKNPKECLKIVKKHLPKKEPIYEIQPINKEDIENMKETVKKEKEKIKKEKPEKPQKEKPEKPEKEKPEKPEGKSEETEKPEEKPKKPENIEKIKEKVKEKSGDIITTPEEPAKIKEKLEEKPELKEKIKEKIKEKPELKDKIKEKIKK